MFEDLIIIAALAFGLGAASVHAESARGGAAAPPISITRPAHGPTRVIFRGAARRPRWLTVDGSGRPADVELSHATFDPAGELTLNFEVRGDARSVRIAMPGVIDIGYDGDHLILFRVDAAGVHDTVMLDELRLTAPDACRARLDPRWSAEFETGPHEVDYPRAATVH